MKKKILGVILAVLMGVSGVMGVAYAEDPICHSNATQELKDAAGCGVTGAQTSNLVGVVVNVLMYIAGALAVIMIVYAGFLYTTSAGDSAKVQKAKNALIYAVVGIAVAILAGVIVNFVVNEI